MLTPAKKSDPALTKPIATPKARRRFPVWLIAALLALVTIALYWPAMGYDFVDYDDPDYVTANPQVQGGLSWEGVKWAFLNPVVANWHPLTVLSHMLASQVFGLKPWGHHLTNLLLHALNAGLVFALLQQLTGARWRSLLVAALFALHPLRVESVAWVSERKDVLSGCFGLLALMAYVRYAQLQSLKSKVQSPKSKIGSHVPQTTGHVPRITHHASRFTLHASRSTLHDSAFYLLSLILFALGLMSKPMLVTWPFVMLLLDYWPLGRMQNAEASNTLHAPRSTLPVSRSTLWRLLVEKLPFFALSALASVVTFVVQRRGGSVMAAEGLPLGARLGNALISYVRYLGKICWPTDLAVFYPHPGQWPLAKLALAGALILGVSVLVWTRRRRYPYLLMGWLWFVGMLVPMIGLVQTGGQAMADRHTYLPAVGVLLLAVWGVCDLTRGWRYQVVACSVTSGGAIVLCLALTRQQLGHWQDSETLFRHAVEVTDNNFLAHNDLGIVLGRKGRIDEAIRQFQAALRLKPNNGDYHYNLGVAVAKVSQRDEAIREFQEALRLKPAFVEAHNDLGIALGEQGQTDEAIGQFREALRLKPDCAEAYRNLGLTLCRTGQWDEAIRQFQEAIRLKPDYALARKNLAGVLDQQGQMDEAIRQYQEVARVEPTDADVRYNLGTLFLRKGQMDEAIHQFQEAVSLRPDDALAHNGLGSALARKGQMDEAIRQFREALRLKPDYATASNNLQKALLKQGQRDGATR